MKLLDLAGWTQAGIAGLTATVGSILWVANTNADLHQTRVQVTQLQQQQQQDHDKVTAQDQKLNDIASDVAEIKGDVKTLVQKVH